MDRSETERGEARPNAAGFRAEDWHVLWTRSHCEELVRRQLTGTGFETFLPMIGKWSTRAGQRHRIDVPLFPGYLFIRGLSDKHAHAQVRMARGLVQVLGQDWTQPAVVPDAEVGAIHKLTQSNMEMFPTQFLRNGERVRVICGPLAGVEGTLVRSNERNGLLVLSISLLQRSVATEVHCSAVTPC